MGFALALPILRLLNQCQAFTSQPGRVGKRAPRFLTLSTIYQPACPPFLNGGQQKDVARPTWLPG